MVTNSNLITPILFDKIKHKAVMHLVKFQVQKAFIWRDMLENNINHILRPHNMCLYMNNYYPLIRSNKLKT
jgi:hypothetical protein